MWLRRITRLLLLVLEWLYGSLFGLRRLERKEESTADYPCDDGSGVDDDAESQSGPANGGQELVSSCFDSFEFPSPGHEAGSETGCDAPRENGTQSAAEPTTKSDAESAHSGTVPEGGVSAQRGRRAPPCGTNRARHVGCFHASAVGPLAPSGTTRSTPRPRGTRCASLTGHFERSRGPSTSWGKQYDVTGCSSGPTRRKAAGAGESGPRARLARKQAPRWR